MNDCKWLRFLDESPLLCLYLKFASVLSYTEVVFQAVEVLQQFPKIFLTVLRGDRVFICSTLFFLSPCGSATLQVFTLTLRSISQNASALQPSHFSQRYLLSQCNLIDSMLRVCRAGLCMGLLDFVNILGTTVFLKKKSFLQGMLYFYFNPPLYALENKESAQSMLIIK